MTARVDVATIGIGWFVSEKQPDDSDYWPKSGPVYGVDRYPNSDGELETWFSVLGQGDASKPSGRLKLHRLRSDQIGTAEEPMTTRVQPYVHALITEMARAKGTKWALQLGDIFCKLRGI